MIIGWSGRRIVEDQREKRTLEVGGHEVFLDPASSFFFFLPNSLNTSMKKEPKQDTSISNN